MATSSRSVIIAHTRAESGEQAIWRGQNIPKGAALGDYWITVHDTLYVLRSSIDRKVWQPIERHELDQFKRERLITTTPTRSAPTPAHYGDF